MMDDTGAAEVALARWLDALNSPHDGDLIAAAVSEQVIIWRHGNFQQRGEIVEHFEGLQQATTWFARCPADVGFELSQRTARLPDGAWQARYAVLAEDFRGGGMWRFRLDDEGKIGWLEHVPDELDPRYIVVD